MADYQFRNVIAALAFALFCRLLKFNNSFFILLNVLTFITFTYDKFCSRQSSKFKRIPEMNLFSMSLGGGWIGGVIAMILFTHKLRKSSFVFIMLLTIIVDIVFSFSIYKFL